LSRKFLKTGKKKVQIIILRSAWVLVTGTEPGGGEGIPVVSQAGEGKGREDRKTESDREKKFRPKLVKQGRLS